MTFKHTAKNKAKTLRIRRLASAVKKQLSQRGIDCVFMASVDKHGAKLTYADLRVGHLQVLVRPLGHVLSFLELDHICGVPRIYVQYGAADVQGLLDAVGKYAALDVLPHWAAAIA